MMRQNKRRLLEHLERIQRSRAALRYERKVKRGVGGDRGRDGYRSTFNQSLTFGSLGSKDSEEEVTLYLIQVE